MQQFILIPLLLILFFQVDAQDTQKVESTFKSGDPVHLSNALAAEVELNLNDEVHFVSSDEVKKILNDWFARVKPSGFNGKIAGGSSVKYYSGLLNTSKGDHKVLVYFNTHKGQYKIDEIRITQQ